MTSWGSKLKDSLTLSMKYVRKVSKSASWSQINRNSNVTSNSGFKNKNLFQQTNHPFLYQNYLKHLKISIYCFFTKKKRFKKQQKMPITSNTVVCKENKMELNFLNQYFVVKCSTVATSQLNIVKSWSVHVLGMFQKFSGLSIFLTCYPLSNLTMLASCFLSLSLPPTHDRAHTK